MAETKVESPVLVGNLFVPVSDVMLSEVIDVARSLGASCPEILRAIRGDQDRLALERKRVRVEEREWELARTETLPGFDAPTPSACFSTGLGTGRSRMDPETVLVFLVISEHFCSIYSGTAVERLLDSLSVYRFLEEKGLKMPGLRTIGDNVNAVGAETRTKILQCQLKLALTEGLDDFNEVCGDSTACSANTRWPTDSSLILRLLARVHREGSRLDRYGLPNFRVHWMEQWLKKLKELDFAINTAKNERARGKLYRKFLDTAGKATWHVGEQVLGLVDPVAKARLGPMLRNRLEAVWCGMLDDVRDVCAVQRQCAGRVFEGKRTKSTERILSLSDEAAAYILKGDRVPVVGYKPQLARSRKGLVTALLVPEGNASDSSMLVPLVEANNDNTGIVPALGSFDDGYTSKEGLEKLRKMGICTVSFSGSKGKALLEDEWDSPILKEARRNRSAVESLMFCIKHCHDFGQLRRRGIDAVRDELMGKILIYNFRRIILLRKRKERAEAETRQAA